MGSDAILSPTTPGEAILAFIFSLTHITTCISLPMGLSTSLLSFLILAFCAF